MEVGVDWEGISSVRGGGGARPNRVGLRLLSKFVISFVYQINKVFLFLPHIWSNSCKYGTVLFINPRVGVLYYMFSWYSLNYYSS